MNTEELESLILRNIETPQLDFKESCIWEVINFAKDILAMSNVQFGGYIIIGVKEVENKFKGEGVSVEIKASYNIDVMRDQMSSFADPHVEFNLEIVSDSVGKEYVVIKMNQFKDIPVICCKDGRETKKGVIYYRNKNRRVESARISNSYDMRDLIELATSQMMKKMRTLGFTVEQIDKIKFKEELGEL